MRNKNNIIRIIPVILVNEGKVVRAEKFLNFLPIGKLPFFLERYGKWDLDELCVINIGKNTTKIKTQFLNNIKKFTKTCFTPLAVGGGISSLKEADKIFKVGADRIILNGLTFSNPLEVKKITQKYGSQSVVVSVNCLYDKKKKKYFVVKKGIIKTNLELNEWVTKLKKMGVGEVLLNNIEYDGTKKGFCIDMYLSVINDQLPIIAVGGASRKSDFESLLKKTNIKSIAASNYFSFFELSYHNLKSFLEKKQLIRNSRLNFEYNSNLSDFYGLSKKEINTEEIKVWKFFDNLSFDE
tara:strand:+ start:89 stop:976 length:888 start_codon:yes stop_codon:yes gene_type:complete